MCFEDAAVVHMRNLTKDRFQSRSQDAILLEAVETMLETFTPLRIIASFACAACRTTESGCEPCSAMNGPPYFLSYETTGPKQS